MTAVRKRKVSKACDSCKSRKKKCEGIQPCSSCVDRGITCSFMIEDRRRTRYEEGKAEVPDISVPDPLNSSFSTYKVSITPSATPSNAKLKLNTNRIPASLRPLLNLPLDESYEEGQSLEKGWSDGHTKNSSVEQRDPGTTFYIGPSSPLALVFLCRNIFSHNSVLDLKSSVFVTDTRKLTKVQNMEPENASFGLVKLPSKENTEFLVNLFLQNMNQSVYILSPEYLSKGIVENVYTYPDRASKDQLCLLYIVLAVGTLFAKAYQKTYPKAAAEALKIPDDVALFHASLNILNSAVTEKSCWIIEANFIMSFYHMLTLRSYSAWMKLQQAIKYAEVLGLNKAHVNNLIKDRESVLHRRRLWRSLYMSDRLLGSLVGQAMGITDSHWDEIDQSIVQNRDFLNECEHQRIKACTILGRIVETMYQSNNRLVFSDLQEFASSYIQWSNGLPYELKSKTFLDLNKLYDQGIKQEKNAKYAYHPLYLLYIAFTYGCILLSRPCLLYMIMRRLSYIEQGNHDKYGPVSQKSFIRNFADSCYNTSKFIIAFLDFSVEHGFGIDRSYAYVNNVFTAGLIIGVVYYAQVAQRNSKVKLGHEDMGYLLEDNESLLIQAINFLRKFSQVDALSERYSEVLYNMFRSIKESENPEANDISYREAEEYNVRKNFEDFLFVSIDAFSDASQASDMQSLNGFLSELNERTIESIVVDGSI